MACSLSTQPHRHSSDRQLLQLPHTNGSSATPNCGMRSLVPCVHHANLVRWDDFFFFNWESHTPLHRVQKVVCLGDIVAVWVWEPGTSLSFISYYPIEFWSLTFSLQNQTIAPVTPQVGWEKQMEGAFWGGNNKIKQYLGMWNEWTQP